MIQRNLLDFHGNIILIHLVPIQFNFFLEQHPKPLINTHITEPQKQQTRTPKTTFTFLFLSLPAERFPLKMKVPHLQKGLPPLSTCGELCSSENAKKSPLLVMNSLLSAWEIFGTPTITHPQAWCACSLNRKMLLLETSPKRASPNAWRLRNMTGSSFLAWPVVMLSQNMKTENFLKSLHDSKPKPFLPSDALHVISLSPHKESMHPLKRWSHVKEKKDKTKVSAPAIHH